MATSTPPSSTPAAGTLYDALAPVYDRWQSADGMTPFALVALAKLLPTLARHGHDTSPAAGSFVDLGCGTGALLLGLGRAHPGWRLLGVDGSRTMLDTARAKAGAERVTWVHQALDTPGLPLSPPPSSPLSPAAPALFDAVGCFYDTLNHLTQEPTLATLVGRVAAGLRPGGLFIFDATNEVGFDLWWRGRRTWHGRGWSVSVETRYQPGTRLGHAQVSIQNGDQHTVAALTERCFAATELRAVLDGAGLEVVLAEPWSPFDIDAPGKTWWITRKKTP